MKNNKQKLEIYPFDEVFARYPRTAEYKRGYEEEVMRLYLARRIAELRATKKMTQKAVAERAGMPQSVIARVESGETGITVDTLGRIANALGKKVQLV